MALEKPACKGDAMSREIGEQLRGAAVQCSQLAKKCADKSMANELEGISALLAEVAHTLDAAFDIASGTSQ